MSFTVVHMWTDANGTNGMSLGTHSLRLREGTCNVTLIQTKDSRQIPGVKTAATK